MGCLGALGKALVQGVLTGLVAYVLLETGVLTLPEGYGK